MPNKLKNTTLTRRKRYVPDLALDMAECDTNYVRLMRLFPEMHSAPDRTFGVRGQMDDGAVVTISILERCRYTTMVEVQVESDEAQERPWLKWPFIEVRVYHDLQSAEVVRFERHRVAKYRYDVPNQGMYQPDEKSQINRFFGELLTFCLAHGYSMDHIDLGNSPKS